MSSSNFKSVKAIYDSLPLELKLLLSPRGRFIDSPFTALRVLSPDKDGFAEAYYMNGGKDKHKAFVTIGVKPEALGKGIGKYLLKNLISKAREKDIRNLVYRLDSKNDNSRKLVLNFIKEPHRVFKDSEEYLIPTMPLYHVSDNPDLQTLNPRVPDNFFTRNGYEDSSTPRVSLAPSIEDALAALSQGGLEGKDMHVYKVNPETLTLKSPSTTEVPDAKATKEMWSLSPVLLELLKKISLIKPIRPRKFKYGDNEAETYTWKYASTDAIANLFKNMQDVYDSLTDEQKKFVDGKAGHIDISQLNPDALQVKDSVPGGYANLWRQDDGTSQVEIAVDPKMLGHGIGTMLLYNILRKADANGIKDIHYIPHKDNNASNALIQKLVKKKPKKNGDYLDYAVDVSKINDPYSAKLPRKFNKAFSDIVEKYKVLGYDVSDVQLKGTTRSRYSSGAVTPYSVLSKELQDNGGSWVNTMNSVYMSPGVKDEIIPYLMAHELAHAVDHKFADDKLRNKVEREAKKSGFTTPYLENLPIKENYKKELFAEWLASKITNK